MHEKLMCFIYHYVCACVRKGVSKICITGETGPKMHAMPKSIVNGQFSSTDSQIF